MEYLATFYNHFGAVRFKTICEKKGMQAHLMPVPRALSSSCGTCVRFVFDGEDVSALATEETEKIVQRQGENFVALFEAE